MYLKIKNKNLKNSVSLSKNTNYVFVLFKKKIKNQHNATATDHQSCHDYTYILK